jgi:hypothetical protein
MALAGNAAKIFTRCTNSGVPYYLLSYLNLSFTGIGIGKETRWTGGYKMSKMDCWAGRFILRASPKSSMARKAREYMIFDT